MNLFRKNKDNAPAGSEGTNKKTAANDTAANSTASLSLNDDRRVKVLSPGTMVAKRFFRNRIAVVGLAILAFMFIFSFIGGLISPYGESMFFYKTEEQRKQYAGVVENKEFRYAEAEGKNFDSVIQAQTILAIRTDKNTFTYGGNAYTVTNEGEDFYTVSDSSGIIGLAFKDVISSSVADQELSFDFKYQAIKAYTNNQSSFKSNGKEYAVSEAGIITENDNEVAYVGRFVVNAIQSDIFLTREFKENLISAIQSGETTFKYKDEEGKDKELYIEYRADVDNYEILELKESVVYDMYSPPSKEHWLGTDSYGMDMLTRLMYGGRVSLLIGFIVEFIATFIGVILGGIAGYFGKWVDMLIMRIVDIFYCIPSMPIIIIIGAAMDAMRVDPKIRMIYLMLILGFLGWPGVARMIRGQILSLREQEFITATEACGVRVSRRIFKHLIPNVIPQLIVSCTMGLGSTIITESTLSFLGLGVKFPFASWGNIISDVTNTHVLTSYWFIWIPAGTLLLLTVLAFNLVGDGLRDAFDPKMKR